MDQSVFQELVSQALDNIQDDFLSCIENVEIVVEEWPTHEHLGGYISSSNVGKSISIRGTRTAFEGHYLSSGYHISPKRSVTPTVSSTEAITRLYCLQRQAHVRRTLTAKNPMRDWYNQGHRDTIRYTYLRICLLYTSDAADE